MTDIWLKKKREQLIANTEGKRAAGEAGAKQGVTGWGGPTPTGTITCPWNKEKGNNSAVES